MLAKASQNLMEVLEKRAGTFRCLAQSDAVRFMQTKAESDEIAFRINTARADTLELFAKELPEHLWATQKEIEARPLGLPPTN
jgi:hypothetical protein